MYQFGTHPSDVVLNLSGAPVSGWFLTMYSQPAGGTRLSHLLDDDGAPLGSTITTDEHGQFRFRLDDDRYPVVWADDGQSTHRWALVAEESYAEIAAAGGNAERAESAASAASDSASETSEAAESAREDRERYESVLAPLRKDLDKYRMQVPTLEELSTTTYIDNWVTSNGNSHAVIEADVEFSGVNFTLITAPFDLRILSVAATWVKWSCEADDEHYWEVHLTKKEEDAPPQGEEAFDKFVTRTTQNEGSNAGGPIEQRVPFTFDGADTDNMVLTKNTPLGISFDPINTPPRDMYLGVSVTVRYIPERRR